MALLAALLFVAACSDPGDPSAQASSSATSASTTTSPAVSPNTTTTTPSTTPTSDPITAAEDAAIQAVLDKADAWRTCIADVPTCNPRESLEPTTTGEALENLAVAVDGFQENGFETRPPLDPSHGREEILSVTILDDGLTEARVTFCQIDGRILVDPAAAPDGSDVVVNDQVDSLLADSLVTRGTDGHWRVWKVERIDNFEGGVGCGVAASS